MRPLCDFAGAFHTASDLLTKLRANIADVDTIIGAGERLAGETLASLRIAPIQRVPRYLLVLQQMAASCAPASGLAGGLAAAIDACQSVAEQMNEAVRRSEREQRTAEIQEVLFRGCVRLAQPGRALILQRTLFKPTRWIRPRKAYCYMLFSDCLVYSQKCLGRSRMRHVLPLAGMRLEPVKDSASSGMRNAWKIIGVNKTCFVQAKNAEIEQEWISALQDAIARAQPHDVGAGMTLDAANQFERSIMGKRRSNLARFLRSGRV